jgi:hypothetical protein
MPFLTLLIQLLLTNPADVPLIAIGRNYRMSGGIIVRLIQTDDCAVGPGRSTTMASIVAAKSLVSWMLAPATIKLKGPPWASTAGFAWSQPCLGLWGYGQSSPPKTGFTHSGLPFPVHTPQLVTTKLDDGPNPGEETASFPPLDG